MKQILYLLFVWLVISCSYNPEQKSPAIHPFEARFKCGEYFANGKINSDSYTFCGIIPHEMEYDYKTEKWSYWNQNKKRIAEGIFRSEIKYVTGEGGCPFQYFESKIDRGQWEFWNDQGELIEANDALIEELEHCKVLPLQ